MIFNFHLKANYKKLFLVETYNLATFFKKNIQDLHRPFMGDLRTLLFHACIYGGIFALRSAAAREGGRRKIESLLRGKAPPFPFFIPPPSPPPPHILGVMQSFFAGKREEPALLYYSAFYARLRRPFCSGQKKARCLL